MEVSFSSIVSCCDSNLKDGETPQQDILQKRKNISNSSREIDLRATFHFYSELVEGKVFRKGNWLETKKGQIGRTFGDMEVICCSSFWKVCISKLEKLQKYVIVMI